MRSAASAAGAILVLARSLALVLVLAAPATAEERIQRFVSDVSVERDGTLDVTETIRINVERDQVRHGILRDIPTIYRDRRGATVQVDGRGYGPGSQRVQAICASTDAGLADDVAGRWDPPEAH